MLCGIAIGHSKPRDLLRWQTPSYRQWQEDPEQPDTIRPHIIIVTCTGAEVKDDELLHGEVGPIVNAIQCRLYQEEFRQTSVFPVQTL